MNLTMNDNGELDIASESVEINKKDMELIHKFLKKNKKEFYEFAKQEGHF